MRVLLVGVRLSQLEAVPGRVEVVHPYGLAQADMESFDTVVLGDRAIESLQPTEVRSHLARHRLVVLLCPDACPGGRLVQWLREGFTELLTPAELAERIGRLEAPVARPRLEPPDWLPNFSRADQHALSVLRTVSRLERPFNAAKWAREVGLSRKNLWKLVVRATGLPPREVLHRYVEVSAAALRSQGATLDEAAIALGYSEPASLAHALRRKSGTVGSPGERPSSPLR